MEWSSYCILLYYEDVRCIFFFQAEDGIRDIGVTGVQTCALPICAVHGSTVLHPCDANQTARLVAQMAEREGISFLRTLRPGTTVIYAPDEDFPIGGSKVVRSSGEDQGTGAPAGDRRGTGLNSGKAKIWYAAF